MTPLLTRRLAASGSATVLLSGLLAGLTATVPAAAHPDACETEGKDGDAAQHSDEICFTAEEIAAMDDSGASLDVDEIASSRNMHLVANVPKTDAFASPSSFNSDLAFQGDYAYQGNYNGVSVWDISDGGDPRLVTQVVCPGAQNDVSVQGDLLITSTDSSRNKAGCDGNVFQPATIEESWEGIRIFDISDPAHPSFVAAVETDCGSHTHTTIPDAENDRTVVYVSSYGPSSDFPDCQPPHDKISVVEIPDDDPAAASVVSEPVLFPDGGFAGVPGQTSATSGCHDITAYPEKGIAAGACMGEGVLMDISDLENPVVVDSVTDPNFAFWHSATFNNDATTVVFTDELGGGGGPTCNPTVGPTRGADAIYRITDSGLELASYYKIPRTQYNTENCVAHNGSLVPVPGKDIMVQSWYQGGVSVFDFTDPANPREIGWWERGPLSKEQRVLGGTWSAYWYNGKIYSSDIQKGLDVLQISDPAIGAAYGERFDALNVQTQRSYGG